jgi:hypothetical protein
VRRGRWEIDQKEAGTPFVYPKGWGLKGGPAGGPGNPPGAGRGNNGAGPRTTARATPARTTEPMDYKLITYVAIITTATLLAVQMLGVQ